MYYAKTHAVAERSDYPYTNGGTFETETCDATKAGAGKFIVDTYKTSAKNDEMQLIALIS